MRKEPEEHHGNAEQELGADPVGTGERCQGVGLAAISEAAGGGED